MLLFIFNISVFSKNTFTHVSYFYIWLQKLMWSTNFWFNNLEGIILKLGGFALFHVLILN